VEQEFAQSPLISQAVRQFLLTFGDDEYAIVENNSCSYHKIHVWFALLKENCPENCAFRIYKYIACSWDTFPGEETLLAHDVVRSVFLKGVGSTRPKVPEVMIHWQPRRVCCGPCSYSTNPPSPRNVLRIIHLNLTPNMLGNKHQIVLRQPS
jgi:hypothetical protein